MEKRRPSVRPSVRPSCRPPPRGPITLSAAAAAAPSLHSEGCNVAAVADEDYEGGENASQLGVGVGGDQTMTTVWSPSRYAHLGGSADRPSMTEPTNDRSFLVNRGLFFFLR